MPRLLGVDIPNNKRIEYALRYVYGIGPSRSKIVLEFAGIDPGVRSHELSEEQLNKIAEAINHFKFRIEGDLRREITSNLKRLIAIQSYRGIRHRKGLPVRGQRTKTNARTRKGGKKSAVAVTRAPKK